MNYATPPASFQVKVPLDSSYAQFVHTEALYAEQWAVRPFGGEFLPAPGSNGAVNVFSLLTPVDAIYEVFLTGAGGTIVFGVPVLGHLLSCRTNLLQHTLYTGKAYPPFVDKTLRTLDALLRSLYALTAMGKVAQAQQLLQLLTPLCAACTCGCDGL